MKRILTCFAIISGCYIGTQMFFVQSTRWLNSGQSFNIQDSAPYASGGALIGYAVAELIGSRLIRSSSRREQNRLSQLVQDEALLHGLTLEQQAVLLEAVRKLKGGNNG